MIPHAEWAPLAWAFLVGCFLGVFFCLHLWRSVQGISSAGVPTFSTAAGFFLRVGVVAAGILLVSASRWERAAAACVGFMVVRRVMVRVIGEEKPQGARCLHGNREA